MIIATEVINVPTCEHSAQLHVTPMSLGTLHLVSCTLILLCVHVTRIEGETVTGFRDVYLVVRLHPYISCIHD